MNILLFGSNGQDGFYLKKLLQNKNIKISNISRPQNKDEINIIDNKSVEKIVKKTQPDYIFHLAANSTTNHSALFENHQLICTGTLNILEAVKKYSPRSKVFISGSGLQFENKNIPIKETDPFEARDAYSVSRIHSVYAARYYRRLGMKVYVGYFFNHDSPRRTERHLSKKIALAARSIAEGKNEHLNIGDLSVIKEWTFAGDVVDALWKFVNQDEFYESNLGSGIGYSIEQWLEICFNIVGRNWKDFVTNIPYFVPEYKILVSDPTRIYSLGWTPKVSFEELAKLMIFESPA